MRLIYLVMRSNFCRTAWWKVGCPDWASSHIDTSWKKCRSSKWLCRGWMREVEKKQTASQATHERVISQIKTQTQFITSKWNPLPQMRALMLIKIPNVSQGPWSLISAHLLSSCHLTYQTGTRIHRSKPGEHRATGRRVRNAQVGDEVGGRYAVMRSSEGKNNKDNDRGRKSCCRHIKLSTHFLGRVSAGLGMKTLNPTMA